MKFKYISYGLMLSFLATLDSCFLFYNMGHVIFFPSRASVICPIVSLLHTILMETDFTIYVCGWSKMLDFFQHQFA